MSGPSHNPDNSREIELRHERMQADGVELHVVRAGSGPSIILLHGFPENWQSWRRQIPALVDAGFSVLVPDMRGYNLSDVPRGLEPYHINHLVADVAALVRASGHPRAHIAGHDWGGVVAWTFAGMHPELVDKLIILNAPHIRIFLKKVRRPPQMFRSWYVPLFRLRSLPERALSAWNFWAVRTIFKRFPVREGAFSDQEIQQYVDALSRPGVLTAALNYYRVNLKPDALRIARAARIEAETLVIWGEMDRALGTELLEGLDEVAPRVRVHRIPDASHWVQNEAADEVNRVLTDFLKG